METKPTIVLTLRPVKGKKLKPPANAVKLSKGNVVTDKLKLKSGDVVVVSKSPDVIRRAKNSAVRRNAGDIAAISEAEISPRRPKPVSLLGK